MPVQLGCWPAARGARRRPRCGPCAAGRPGRRSGSSRCGAAGRSPSGPAGCGLNVSSSSDLVSSSRGGCRLLDDEQGRVAQDGPGQGDAELLADAQRMAQLADGRLVALRQLLDEVVGVGHLGRLDDLRQRVRRVAAADVVGHRVVEDQVVLQHDGDLRPQRIERHPAQVVLVDADLAGGRVEEARDQVNQGVLLQVVGADQADALAGRDRSARRPRSSMRPVPGSLQADVVELQLLGQRRQELGADHLADLAGPIEELEQRRPPTPGRGAGRAGSPASFDQRPVQADQGRRQRDGAGRRRAGRPARSGRPRTAAPRPPAMPRKISSGR